MTTATAKGKKSARTYQRLTERAREAGLLHSTAGLLGWDQEVMMPPGGVEFRSRQLAQLARLHHQMATDRRFGDLIAKCESDDDLMGDPTSVEAVNVRELRWEYDRMTKLPAELVAENARLSSVGRHTWGEARARKDFSHFRPVLEQIVDLLRRTAECLGWDADGEPWDALAEGYEKGCTARDIAAVFTPLRERLRRLLDDLMGAPTPPANDFNELTLPIEQQKAFVRFVAEALGFDFTRGRLDISTHPFCSPSHCRDVRMTTRYAETNVLDALGSTMHETGHGLYEQGLLFEHVGTPMGQSVSLGIHESQSRLWENQVGRSRAFWKWCVPKLRDFFGAAVSGLSLDDVYGAANIVRPDFIRVEADEATYNMHIMVRFELECAIMRGDLAVADIPDAWNQKYQDYLGLDVPDDAKGCLQDVHWSMASMGYFPTYTLGNLYAAQFFEQASEDIDNLPRLFEQGQFGALKSWLNESIHAHGQRFRAADLCVRVTGKPLGPEPLMRYLEGKLRPLYGVDR